MNLDQIEQGIEQSTRQILNSLGVIQELLKTEKPKKILRKKVSKKEVFKIQQEEILERTEIEIQRDIYPDRIVYEKTPCKPRKKKKNKIGFSYSTFVVDTSSSSEDDDWKNSG